LVAELPLAHVGHYLWVLYIPPVAVVLFAIIRTTIVERRAAREDRQHGKDREPGR
jgi:hypothetical protein